MLEHGIAHAVAPKACQASSGEGRPSLLGHAAAAGCSLVGLISPTTDTQRWEIHLEKEQHFTIKYGWGALAGFHVANDLVAGFTPFPLQEGPWKIMASQMHWRLTPVSQLW